MKKKLHLIRSRNQKHKECEGLQEQLLGAQEKLREAQKKLGPCGGLQAQLLEAQEKLRKAEKQLHIEQNKIERGNKNMQSVNFINTVFCCTLTPFILHKMWLQYYC